ncbi:hypothetical protein CCR95_14340 [Thiocystis minor]|uniref:hypothetical protein n=1 Tax=Thiocystis minor TaxID=61597 RepID=UPI0019126E5A|nr:hypothetical protein [Thiocystis minor]MBK5965235.1 hypothetical protein [Thiocystis minor]
MKTRLTHFSDRRAFACDTPVFSVTDGISVNDALASAAYRIAAAIETLHQGAEAIGDIHAPALIWSGIANLETVAALIEAVRPAIELQAINAARQGGEA